MNLTTRILFVLVGFSLTMCTSVIRDAETAYKSENYSESSELCEKAYQKIENNKKKKGDMAFKAAQSYRNIENPKEANNWFETCILLDYQEVEPEVHLFNGDALLMLGEFEKAKEQYELYQKIVPGDARADVGVKACESAKAFEVERTRHNIEFLEVLNGSEFDMAPMLGGKRKDILFFSSSRDGSEGKSNDPRTGESYMDLWFSELDKKGEFKEPKQVEGDFINTIDNEGTVAFDPRFKTMFFTRCPNMKKENLGCEIWFSEGNGKNVWKEPTKIEGLKAHDSISIGHPATPDGFYMIFVSDQPGGFGGKDLYYTVYNRKDKAWGAPVNMGPEINTKGDELFPSFALNGDLIFASNGRPGLGGLDIYRAGSTGDNTWGDPQNMMSPINSVNNDYALIEIDEKSGYFTSERKSETGEYQPDLYKYELPPNLFTCKVRVSEKGNEQVKIEDVKVVVKGSDKSTWEGYTLKDGSVYWDKRPVANAQGNRYVNEDVSYTINISKDGYHEDKNGSSFSTIDVNEDRNFVIDMGLLPKKPINLPEVRYPLNQWVLLVDSTINSTDSLQYVFDLLEEYPGMVLELDSHTDSRGRAERNRTLAENRARACYVYLVKEKGVDPRRIVPKGKGEDTPRTVWLNGDDVLVNKPADMTGVEEKVLSEDYINSFKSNDRARFDLLHQLNRRTDARVITMDFDPETAEPANPEFLKFLDY